LFVVKYIAVTGLVYV